MVIVFKVHYRNMKVAHCYYFSRQKSHKICIIYNQMLIYLIQLIGFVKAGY